MTSFRNDILDKSGLYSLVRVKIAVVPLLILRQITVGDISLGIQIASTFHLLWAYYIKSNDIASCSVHILFSLAVEIACEYIC